MLLQLNNVQKSIGILEILTDVSFFIEEREKAALVGINGAGKTSVFRLLTGEWEADEGEISKRQGIVLGYLPQLTDDAAAPEDNTDGNLSLYEALKLVFLDLSKMESELRNLESSMAALKDEALEEALKKYDRLSVRFQDEGGFETESRLKGVLRGLGFSEEQWKQSFNSLSGGERTRALLGKLLLTKADLLLLDEPTNHLDIDSVMWLEEYLRNFPGAVVFISHDRYFIDKVATKTIEIENKKSTVYNGNYTYFAEKKAADRINYEKRFKEQQKVIKHHEEVIKTLRSYKTEAAIIRAKSREKLLAKIERMDTPAQDPDKMRLRLKPRLNSGNDVIAIENMTMGFGNKTLYKDISFALFKGDKTALIGPNGIGKTTLLKNLTGDTAPISGTVREGVNVRVGYYDQSHTFSAESESKTIFEEIADTYPKLTQTEIRTTLGAFMFKGDDVFKPISALSGGERGRVQLTKIMLAGANFLVLDEPTNHLDMNSKEILEEALREFKGTLLYIPHDRYFINNTATKIMELSGDGIAVFHGNYDTYLEAKTKEKLAAELKTSDDETERPAQSAKEEWLQRKEEESKARRKKSAIERIESKIAETEEQIAECDGLLHDEEVCRDPEALQEVFNKKTALEENLSALYDEWQKINEEEK